MADKHRVALVTGGMGGLGEAICIKMAALGYTVVTTYSPGNTKAQEWLAAMKQQGYNFRAYPCDVADWESAAACVKKVGEEVGPVDVLVNNAGYDEWNWFTATDEALWRRVLEVNLIGVIACTHAVLPGMQERRRGRIVNVSSEAGRVGSSGSAVYSAAKGGVLAFTKAIAIENGRYGITSNAVAPGPIETPLLMAAPEHLGDIGKRIVDNMIGSTNLRRLGHPDEVAAAIAFLASDDASYVTGQSLGVSGGLARI